MRRAPHMALVAFPAALLTACSGAADSGADAKEPSGKPAVTAEESREVLKDWTERHNRAITSGDVRLWRDTVTGALEAPVTARVRTYGKLPKSARISLSNPVFYVPRQDDHPKWFGVAALERSGGDDQQVLGVFVRKNAETGWHAAHWLTFQGRPPQLAYDRQGYAIPAPDRDLPTAHANYLKTGDRGALTPDTHTSNARAEDQGDWTVTHGAITPGPGPSYALRTEDGGSLVWYALKQEKTLTGGTPATLPTELRDHLKKNGDKPETLRTTWQWLAIGYAPPTGKARILGESVSLTKAS
ncbi:hypothetical protein [Actinomadura sp. 7K507]|uniref:hypothetical protein n=1 Tax=Actinomadura sp. 7K507 TaxID=2530365 RepID=UPI0010429568|nr:hypothetical protein [Actinomadura sp. 7K507]TDC93290.1 hypothetical protein E1285_10410 [Actinomadura sp. 7K507]